MPSNYDPDTIKAPENPNALRLAQAIQGLDRRTKGSVMNLAVPSALGDVLNKWAYGQKTSTADKIFAAADVGGGPELGKFAPLLATFIGPRNAKETAEAMAVMLRKHRGEDPAALWQETGWGAEPVSGNPVREISDSGMKMKTPPVQHVPMELADVIDHPELFAAAPELRSSKVMGTVAPEEATTETAE